MITLWCKFYVSIIESFINLAIDKTSKRVVFNG